MQLLVRFTGLFLALFLALEVEAQGHLFGLHNSTGQQNIASIWLDSQYVDPGPIIAGGYGYALGSSTFDTLNNQFIFIAATNSGGTNITVVDPVSGSILNSFPSVFNLTGLEFDDTSLDAWGLLWDGNNEYLAQIDFGAQTVTLQWLLPGVNSFVAGSSTFDPAGGRYICVTNLGVTQIDVATGNIVSTFPSQGNMSELEYDPNTGNCYAMSNVQNQAHLMEVDLNAQTITDLGYVGFQAYVAGATSFNHLTREYAVISSSNITIIDVDNTSILNSFPTIGNLGAIEWGNYQSSGPPPPPPACDTTKVIGTVLENISDPVQGSVVVYEQSSLLGTFLPIDTVAIDSPSIFCWIPSAAGTYTFEVLPDPVAHPNAQATFFGGVTTTAQAQTLALGLCDHLVALNIDVLGGSTAQPCDSTGFLGNVTIGVDAVMAGWVYLLSTDSTGTYVVDSTMIDSLANYAFLAIPAGTYTLQAVADPGLYPNAIPTYIGGFAVWSQGVGQPVGPCEGPYLNNNITVLEIAPAMGGNTLNGTVSATGRTNTPMEGIAIMVSEASMGLLAATHTNANGWYEFTDLPAGTYTIMINALNHHMATTHTVSVTEGFEQDVSYDYEMTAGQFHAVEGAIASAAVLRAAQAFALYPNPASHTVTLEGENILASSTVTLLDVTGRVVHTQRSNNEGRLQLNVSGLTPGSYLLQLSNSTERHTQHLLIQ